MALSARAFLALLGTVALLRLFELGVSSRNRARLSALGIEAVPEPRFPCMVALHVAILVGAGAEVVVLRRPFIPPLAAAAGTLFVLATAVRFWVVRTLALHWNVRVMASMPLGVVSTGPYRFVRHPNYAAVFVELLALPLIHTAWITAALGALAHAAVLRARVATEEAVLLADPAYRAVMGPKRRFVPR